MCGISAIFGVPVDIVQHSASFEKIKHRGPDAWRIEYDRKLKNSVIGFHRLDILDSLHGMQPMRAHFNPNLSLICNGEIYNCKRLQEQFHFEYSTNCDVECILHLYARHGAEDTASQLDGVFAFCLVDMERHKLLIARDPFGVCPLFCLRGPDGILGVCSEAKGLISFVEGQPGWKIEPFPPGHFAEYDLLENGSIKLLRQQHYYKIGQLPRYRTLVAPNELGEDVSSNLRKLLTAAVRKRLMAERRIGCLLSGGLDSSLVAALLVQLAKEEKLPYKIQSFSIGMSDSPDILAARKVAAHLGTEHHEVLFTEADVRRVFDKVLYHLETADITTVRASLGMFLVAEYIKENTSTTVVMSGEGADEVAQGYIYFRDSPSALEGHVESLRLLNDLHLFDVLRADRTMAANGLEVRVPFLDHHFSQYYLSLPPETRQPRDGIEKYLLRKAFDGTGMLPDSILWRHKEAFSDGVASKKKSLFTIIQDMLETSVSDTDLASSLLRFPHCTPRTKESFYYRVMLEKNYPGHSHFLPYFWMPRWSHATDPSARFISHYAAQE